jgi:pimeloyl-ACP methyl ester carboxylesterase
MTIYLLSGLGADYRAFKNLKLPRAFHCIHIVYAAPQPEESLQSYAQRIIAMQIDTTKPFSIIGLSFGGILTMELLNYIKPVNTILISSITNKYELPFLYRIAGKLKLNKFIPSKKVNKPNWLTYWIFGIKEQKDKALLAEILTSSNTQFSKWAVNEIVNWKRKITPPNLYRIHGNKDRLLPMKRFVPDYTIKNGGHLLIVQHGNLVSEVVANFLMNTK